MQTTGHWPIRCMRICMVVEYAVLLFVYLYNGYEWKAHILEY